MYVTRDILKKVPKTVSVDKIYYLDRADKQMQLISILLAATLARSFSLRATRPERKESTVDIMSVALQFHSVAVTYHRARERHGSLA